MPELTPSWRHAFNAFAPSLPTRGLVALARALREDDPRLIQEATTGPLPLSACSDWPVEAACPVAYTGWQDGLESVAEVEEFFGRACLAADERLGEPAGCRWLLNWWDDTPRDEVRALLLPAVLSVLAERGQVS